MDINSPCNQCGKCCHYYSDGAIYTCAHLKIGVNTATKCDIYGAHLGTVLGISKSGVPIVCRPRKACSFDFSDCPANTNKPIYPYDRLLSLP